MKNSAKEDETIEFIHPWIKNIFTAAASLISLYCFSLLGIHLHDPSMPLSNEVNIVNLMAYSVIFIILINIPWAKLFYKIKKIGPFEFQHAIENQIKDIVYLEDRLSAVENYVENTDELGKFMDSFYEDQIKDKLIDFLNAQSPTAFSPTRIIEWGGKRPGYEIFSRYDDKLIRRYLRKLLSEDKLSTTISKKGNILYRIADD